MQLLFNVYCLSKSHTCHITSSLLGLERVLKMSASSTSASAALALNQISQSINKFFRVA